MIRMSAIFLVTIFTTLSATAEGDWISKPEGKWLKVRATAYEPSERSCGVWADGITSTGIPARVGTIAVDPTVIPLGSRLFVPEYGWGVAEDVGGAIKGKRIDVFFWTVEEALDWGIQDLDVFVMPGDAPSFTENDTPMGGHRII
ncbi:MAG TPA: 3D domain-containing protein [Nitrospiria bacterium]|jgi:3D (Asp-Asp-Asp) domain-containing protein